MVPSDVQQNQVRPEPGRPTTRISGELPLDALPARGSARPSLWPDVPRVEVTQPYIPAIRDEQPEFAKRLNPDPPPAPSPAPTPTPSPAPTALTGTPPPAAPAVAAPTTPAPTTGEQPTVTQPRPAPQPAPAAPPRRRSLMRRVVRRIIGPDLLRKDPPKKKR
ncbi:hypothetical protein [Saccharopolyspora cebuensis]|uniref:hypothetical protein n=1 Tax=Saccharopolyspora cebuensis TaxID=418759 RepID=UPI0031F0BA09